MDTFRAFEDSADYDLQTEDEPTLEAPPEIGIDERRMHVRAYNYWVSLLDGRAYPSIEDLEPETLDDFGPHSVLLDFTAGSANPAVAFLGRALREECDLRGEIRTIEDVPGRSLISRLTDHYLQIIANSAPIGFEAEFVNQRGRNTMYRGILMPLSSDGDTIDFIYGVINWKEVVEEEVASGIADEINRVVAAPPAVEASPVWADGPSGDSLGDFEFASALPAGESEDVLDLDGFYEDADQHFLSLDPAPEAEAPEEEAAIEPEPEALEEEHSQETSPEPAEEPAAEVADDWSPEPIWTAAPPSYEEDLADRLAAARICAEEVKQADARSRTALYRALGQAYAFALATEESAEDYAELLADAGIKPQARAPMTPVVKLVFGATYDKTRLAEYAAALSHGRRHAIPADDFASYLERFDGGLKGVVKAERDAKRPAAAPDPIHQARQKLRTAAPVATLDVDFGCADEFVLLVARREPAGGVAILTSVADRALVDRAIRKSAR